MNSPTLTTPQEAPLTGRVEKVIAVAVLFSGEFTDPSAVSANLLGACVMERCLANALRASSVKLNQSGAINPALSRGVFLFFVPEVKTALAVIVDEMRALGLESWFVVGVFDRAEDYWRALHPAKPRFDLNARMNEVMPLGRPGEKTKSQPHPEFKRIQQILQSAPYPVPSFKNAPPTETPTAPPAA